MTTKDDIKRIAVEISRLGSATIKGAHLSHFGANGSDISDMATNLAGAVARGDISMAVIKAATPMPTTSPLSGGTDPAVKAMEATTNRAMDAALEAHQLAINTKQGLNDLVSRVSTVADMSMEVDTKLTKLERSLNKKLGEVRGEVDPVDLQNQVAKAVADTFAPFKQAVTTEVMTEVADLALSLIFCKQRRTVFQAGGNFGIYPLELAKHFDTVYTVEPDMDNYRALKQNIANSTKIIPMRAGLGIRELVS